MDLGLTNGAELAVRSQGCTVHRRAGKMANILNLVGSWGGGVANAM
jgi:hypothetical protein